MIDNRDRSKTGLLPSRDELEGEGEAAYGCE